MGKEKRAMGGRGRTYRKFVKRTKMARLKSLWLTGGTSGDGSVAQRRILGGALIARHQDQYL